MLNFIFGFLVGGIILYLASGIYPPGKLLSLILGKTDD